MASDDDSEEFPEYWMMDKAPPPGTHRATFRAWSVEPEREGEASIHRLPDDVLVLIMQQLEPFARPRLGSVCRRWYNISRASFKNLVFLHSNGPLVFLSEHTSHDVLNNAAIFSKSRPVLQSELINLIYLIRSHLKSFSIENSEMCLDLWKALHSCSGLKSLELINCTFPEADSTTVGAPPSLEELTIRLCFSLDEIALERLLTKAPKVSYLHIYTAAPLTGECIVDCLRGNKIKEFQANCFSPEIYEKILRAFGETLEDTRLSLNGELLTRLGNNPLPMMKKLKNLGCEDFDGLNVGTPQLEDAIRHFNRFLECTPNLTWLYFGKIEESLETSDEIVPCITNNCPGIKSIDLYDLEIMDGGSNLKLLSGLRNLTSLTVGSVMRGTQYEWIVHCTKLTDLNFHSSNITDQHVFMIVRYLEKLSSLNFEYCSNLSGEFMELCKVLTRTEPPLVVWIRGSEVKLPVPPDLPSFMKVVLY